MAEDKVVDIDKDREKLSTITTVMIKEKPLQDIVELKFVKV